MLSAALQQRVHARPSASAAAPGAPALAPAVAAAAAQPARARPAAAAPRAVAAAAARRCPTRRRPLAAAPSAKPRDEDEIARMKAEVEGDDPWSGDVAVRLLQVGLIVTAGAVFVVLFDLAQPLIANTLGAFPSA